MRTFAIGLFVFLGGVASATDLTGLLTVDNEFTAYLSTDDSTLGTQIATSSNWNSPQSFTVSLTPGTTYYIHVVGFNDGGPDMFIGTFGLSDAGFSFANGGQALNTDTTNWQGNLTGFGNAYSTPLDYGQDGLSPWGTLGMDSNARFIWMDSTDSVNVNNYFTTTITPNAVPEPASLGVLGIGAVALMRRRKLRANR